VERKAPVREDHTGAKGVHRVFGLLAESAKRKFDEAFAALRRAQQMAMFFLLDRLKSIPHT
jgi:hypothetical protein